MNPFAAFLIALKAQIDKLPHWLILVFAAGVGAAFSYFQAEPNAQILSALTSWHVAWPMVQGAAVAFCGTVIALLKTAPWSGSSSGGGVVALSSKNLVTIPPAPRPPAATRRRLRAVPMIALGAAFLIACASLPAVIADVATIATDLVQDIQKGGMTPEQIAADIFAKTGSQDWATVVAIIDSVLGDPELATKSPELVTPLQAVRIVAAQKYAAQHQGAAAACAPSVK